jgi:hypothetical protein
MVGTEASKAQFTGETLAARLAQMPLGRFGSPQEIARRSRSLPATTAATCKAARSSSTADGRLAAIVRNSGNEG